MKRKPACEQHLPAELYCGVGLCPGACTVYAGAVLANQSTSHEHHSFALLFPPFRFDVVKNLCTFRMFNHHEGMRPITPDQQAMI